MKIVSWKQKVGSVGAIKSSTTLGIQEAAEEK